MVAYRSSSTSIGGPVPRPTGAVVGDLLVAFAASDGTNPITAPAGWTKIAEDVSSGGRTVRMATFWRYDNGSVDHSFVTGGSFAATTMEAFSAPHPTVPIAGQAVQTYAAARSDSTARGVAGGVLYAVGFAGTELPGINALFFSTPAGTTQRAVANSGDIFTCYAFTHLDVGAAKTSTHTQGVPIATTVAIARTNNPPTAPTVTSPNGGERFTGIHTITWTAGADVDGDALTYDVELSRDAGGSWSRIGTGVSGLSLSYDFGQVAFTGQALVRVRAVDPSGEVSPFDQSNATFTVDRDPTAPALGFPSGGQSIDRNTVQRFSWTHTDPDAGDGQARYDLRYRIVGAPAFTTVGGSTPSQFRDFAAGTFALGNYEWQVRTYDSLGFPGPYSASGFFTAIDAPPGPVITAPVNNGTIATNPFTVTWNTAQQDAYQLRTVAVVNGAPDPATVYTDTGIVEAPTARSRSVAFPANPRTEAVQLRVRFDGLFSPWTTNIANVSYTPPAKPTVALDNDDAAGTITVTVTNPTPIGTEPAAQTNDVIVTALSGRDPYRPVGVDVVLARNVPVNGVFVDRAPASGVDYAYRARAYAGNGTSSEGNPNALPLARYSTDTYDSSLYV